MTLPRDQESPPGTGRARPQGDGPSIPSPPDVKIASTVAETADALKLSTGCPHGCGPDGHEPDCGITAPPADPGTCRCQRARWTGEGVFICVCRQEVA